VLQFAAIRTDMALKEIERYEILVKLRHDVIPSPDATLMHRISIIQSMQGMCEFEAVSQIHRFMNQQGTISLGYNTSTFDDEFLRFCFHRNLLPPYSHQYKNGCRRMDLLPITNMYYLYKRGVLNWPEIDGKPTMRLEHLNTANQLAAGQAHNAMVDAEACLELARRFFSKEPKMWHYLVGFFDKETDRKRVLDMPISFQSIACSNRVGLMVGNEFGSENHYQVPVLFIGHSIPYKNQTIWLRLDRAELRETSPETISEKSWVVRKKFGEPGFVLPPLERYWACLSEERLAIVEENKDWLQRHTQLFRKIIQYHCEFRYPKIPDLDIDAALYQNGFLSSREQALCSQFHGASLAEKVKMVGQFEDVEMRQLASRLLCRNYSDDQALPAMLTKDFEGYMRRVNPKSEDEALCDHKNRKRTTPLAALGEVERLRRESELDSEALELLEELEEYIKLHFSG
jgi:exodeoxyribonuclease-1